MQTQLHTVPPVAAALGLCLITAIFSDLTRLRFPFAAFGTGLLIAGLAILMTVHHSFPTQYAALCLVAMGAHSAAPVILCWYIMNLVGHTERSIGTAWIISFGNLGAIVATFSFLVSDAPLYHKGYSICMGAACLGGLAIVVHAGLVWRENMKLRAAEGNSKNLKYC